MKDFDEILIKLQDEVESREMDDEVRSCLWMKHKSSVEEQNNIMEMKGVKRILRSSICLS